MTSNNRRYLVIYLALTLTVGAVFYVLLFSAGNLGAAGGLPAFGVALGLAALCVVFTAWTIRGRIA